VSENLKAQALRSLSGCGGFIPSFVFGSDDHLTTSCANTLSPVILVGACKL
jgi:hypothetical protein